MGRALEEVRLDLVQGSLKLIQRHDETIFRKLGFRSGWSQRMNSPVPQLRNRAVLTIASEGGGQSSSVTFG
ncbi:hypothetical protein D3I60_05710 [Brevibacterium permense]|nr:hypothetical protein [Brevibacterium permense]